jgi:Galactose oxidase, central domain
VALTVDEAYTVLSPFQLAVFLSFLSANGRWSVPETQSAAAKPEARMGHSAVFDPKLRTIYVFGGSKNKKWFNDIQTVDTDTWQLLCVQVC